VAPADAPLHLLPLPKAGGDPEIDENNNAMDVRIHDYINNLQFSISPTAFFQVHNNLFNYFQRHSFPCIWEF